MLRTGEAHDTRWEVANAQHLHQSLTFITLQLPAQRLDTHTHTFPRAQNLNCNLHTHTHTHTFPTPPIAHPRPLHRFYYIDLLMIVAAYLPCMCVVGWLVDETASVRSRLNDVFFTALLEITVAAATLIYCLFLMPMFYALASAWFQMLWLTVLHPLYFEATTGFIVRKILHRNRALGRTHVVSVAAANLKPPAA